MGAGPPSAVDWAAPPPGFRKVCGAWRIAASGVITSMDVSPTLRTKRSFTESVIVWQFWLSARAAVSVMFSLLATSSTALSASTEMLWVAVAVRSEAASKPAFSVIGPPDFTVRVPCAVTESLPVIVADRFAPTVVE